jgi:hypothetical protein
MPHAHRLCLFFALVKTKSSATLVVPNKIAIIKKSNPLQFTSSENRDAMNGISKRTPEPVNKVFSLFDIIAVYV